MSLADDPEITRLSQAMADLTRPRCGGPTCGWQGKAKFNCCEKMYCDIAEEYANMLGVKVDKPGPIDLPYMGKTGCVMPPHLRLVCTVHDCQINNVGADPKDKKFTAHYFILRDALNQRLEKVDSKSIDDTGVITDGSKSVMEADQRRK